MLGIMLALVLGVFLRICAASSGINSGKASDFYIKSLPCLAKDAWLPEMHAGLLEVGTKLGLDPASLFFWHTRAYKDTQTTIIWLNGGPGCSSMDGNLLELGPFRIRSTKDGTPELYNLKGSWAESANLLFIDQPFGTGYSDPEENHFLSSVEQAAEGVVQFLIEYAIIFPEIAQTKLILAGESFAGYYVPHVWHAFQSSSEAQEKLGQIEYVMLNNPWLDPGSQYSSTLEFAKDRGLIKSKHYRELETLHETCIKDLQAYTEKNGELPVHMESCEATITYVSNYGIDDNAKKCLNVYDYTLESPYPSCGMEWPPQVGLLQTWLSRPDVREALHGPNALNQNSVWQECSGKVSSTLVSAAPAKKFMPEMLSQIPVILVIGDNDIICNAAGQDRLVQNLEWNGGTGFVGEPTETDYGTFQSERNLTMVHITNASHMSPYDQPVLTQDILIKFANISTPAEADTDGETDTEADTDDGSSKEESNEEEINRAMYRAYAQASIVALIVVIIVFCIVGFLWWRTGQGIGCKGLVHALLQSGMKIKTQKRKDYVPLRSMGRTPDVIIEEDEEEDFTI